MFTGDAEWEEEYDLLNAEIDLSADVLKVGHHGSETSSNYRFLRKVSPLYAVISVGKGNKYEHPSEITLSRLKDANIITYRTDHDGLIEMVSDGKDIIIYN